MAKGESRSAAAARKARQRRAKANDVPKPQPVQRAEIPESQNRLLTSTAQRDIGDFTQSGATSATSVSVPYDIYDKMREVKDDTGIAPARQMLNALRTDKEGGEVYRYDKTAPGRGAGSGKGGHRVVMRVPTEEYLNIKELSYKKSLPMAQLFLNAWKRQYKWKNLKQQG